MHNYKRSVQQQGIRQKPVRDNLILTAAGIVLYILFIILGM